MRDHINVLIATPGSMMESAYVRSLVNTITELNDRGISYQFLNQYTSRVAAARESTAMDSTYLDALGKSPLHGSVTYDKIFWIDSDISWTPEDFLKLYNSKHKIISGLYLSDHGVPMFAPLSGSSEFSMKASMSSFEPVEIEAAGFGFICVANGVFESMQRPWFRDQFYLIKNEETGKDVYIPYGEDYSWCHSAKSVGHKIFLDPSVKLTHHKKVSIKP